VFWTNDKTDKIANVYYRNNREDFQYFMDKGFRYKEKYIEKHIENSIEQMHTHYRYERRFVDIVVLDLPDIITLTGENGAFNYNGDKYAINPLLLMKKMSYRANEEDESYDIIGYNGIIKKLNEKDKRFSYSDKECFARNALIKDIGSVLNS